MIQTNDMLWNKETRHLVAWASDGLIKALMYNVLPSSIDVMSSHTGRVITFDLNKRNYENEELVSWDYTSDETDVKVVIYND